MAADTLTLTPGAVATGRDLMFPYPPGRLSSDYSRAGSALVIDGTTYDDSDGVYSLSFEPVGVRVTWKSGSAVPSGLPWALTCVLQPQPGAALEALMYGGASQQDLAVKPASRYGLFSSNTRDQTAGILDMIEECGPLGAIGDFGEGRFIFGGVTAGGVGLQLSMLFRGVPNQNVGQDLATTTQGTIFEMAEGATGPHLDFLETDGCFHLWGINGYGRQGSQSNNDAVFVRFADGATAGRSGSITLSRGERYRGGLFRFGANRNAYHLERVIGLNCGWDTDGVTPADSGKDIVLLGSGSDGRIRYCDFGTSSRNAIYNTGAGTLEILMTNGFACLEYGYRADDTAADSGYYGGSLDRNRRAGYFVIGHNDPTRGFKHVLWKTVLAGNSFSANDTYSDIRLLNCHGDVEIDGVKFMKSGATANKVKYNIHAEGTTTDILVSNVIQTGDVTNVSGFTNDASRLIRTIPGRGLITGLEIANDTTDAVNDFTVAAGVCKDNADELPIQTSATVLKQIDVEFAEYSAPGTASGGRAAADNLTGAKWFHVYMIAGFGKPAQPFAATSLTPTLPTGFTRKRRIGSIYWTGSTIKAFTQNADQFIWVAGSTDLAAGTWTSTAALTTLLVPLGVKVEALLGASFTSSSGAQYARIEDPISTDGGVSATSGIISSVNGTLIGTTALRCRTDTSSRVRRRSSDASGTGSITTRGWYDPRGRDI